ncbi:restriction endonuclease subunit S [Clostridium beijerinckii]|nr:restriction endonuclease subunit S [Clostridium beijerinckii]MZK52049.1 hypothetical protein [Clostridium beijerinckii]MZK60190.1 hypothetical protein [Clostridium beijerinckii]MZK70475.1 hypothetical protein [Clostridium beijerinckii]MZK75777.1 hypothetical protein [Clostridium beijerinckii]MZK85441.1 hypothetical protein [Clostridium beijerinckii]
MNKEIAERIELINQGRIPKGYKENNNLKIPNEWNVLNLGNIMDFKNGLNYGKNDVGEEIKILGVGDFQKNFYLKTSDLNKIKYSDLDKNYLLENGDLIFVRSNGNKELIGRVLYCENIEEKVTYSGFTIRGRLNSNDFLDKYCAYYCSSNLVKKQYMQNGGGTNISNLSQEILANVKITKPPIKEQEKIIRIISTFDRLIELKEKLLQEKQKQKKGLMERLLSGKVRVSSFKKKWNRVTINKIIEESKDIENDPKFEKLMSVKLHLQGVHKRAVSGTEVDGATTVYKRKKGQFIYGKQNFHNGAIGIIPTELDGFGSSNDIPAFDFKNGYSPLYFYYYWARENYYKKLESATTGTGSKRLNPKELLSISIKVPEYEEQLEIVKIIKLADKELDLLKKEIEALKKQKKGLMQLLLTGIVRV